MTTLFLKILTRWFNRIRIPDGFAELHQDIPQAIIVTQSKSIVYRAFLHSIAKRCGWEGEANFNNPKLEPAPKVLNWVSFDQLSKWESPAAGSSDRRFLPLSVFNLRGPVRSHAKHKLGLIDVAFLFCGNSVNSYILGSPIDSKSNDPLSNLRLERKLKVEFYRNQKVVRGTPFEAIDTQCRTVLSGPKYHRELRVLSKRMGVSEWMLHKQAKKSFYEIAAHPRTSIFRIAAVIVRPFLKHLFPHIILKGSEHIAPTVRENATVMVPMHRSHFDYLIIGSEIYDSRLNTPLTAAGINLKFWPFGFFIRSLGGYFVKRDSTDRVYGIVLKRYVSYLIKRGHLQKFYIEGGRSRTGKMRKPKIGLLGMFVEAYCKGLRKDISFIPVSLTYENVVEGASYGKENTGSEKVKENWKSLIKAGGLLKKRYGEVVLRFAEPVNISSLIDKAQIESSGDIRRETKKLAYLLTEQIRASSDISFTALAFTALMASPRYGLSEKNLKLAVKNLCRVVGVMQQVDSRIGEFTPSLEGFLAGNEDLVLDLPRTGIAVNKSFANQTVISVPGSRRFTADFYRNATAHLFLPAAILAASELIDGEITLKQTEIFRRCLQGEYLLPDEKPFRERIETLLKNLEADGLLTSSKGKHIFATREIGLFNPGLLLGSIQALLYTFDSIVERAKSFDELPLKEILVELHDEFKSTVYLGKYQRTEASAKSSIASALDSLKELGVVIIREDEEKGRVVSVAKTDLEEILFLKKANKTIAGFLADLGTDE